MFVKPADGRAVRWPQSLRLLKTTGEEVPSTGFWLRALSRGDVRKVNRISSAQITVSNKEKGTT
ncbi:hypothetical protein A0U92_03605 [Acetobacter aceti]|uniref:DUF2635 domain-containing protein n=1 Tax=Acetobacter aceti TaxID=435 RepID=A0A1U9KDW9_ACEAC|nr:DUF2635 domain-containing protein [Acetobacter aceti]AQS84005.1 hypothetical protein A0U92_03605 [Acetobacter aceti]